MTENEVVDCVAAWLTRSGAEVVSTAKGRRRGDDVAASLPNGSRLFVECKGSVGDDWKCAAMAVFGAIKDTEELRPDATHAIAVPDDESYRRTIGRLDGFFVRQRIVVIWVQADGQVKLEGSPLERRSHVSA